VLDPSLQARYLAFRAGRAWSWRETSHWHRPMFLFYGSTGNRKTFAVFIGKSFLWDPPSSVVLPTRSCPFWQTPRESPLRSICHTVCRHSSAHPRYTRSIHARSRSPTPCSRILLDKLTVPQPVKKIVSSCETRRFVTVFTTALNLSCSCAR
jgi:hypothetical protein